MSLNKNKIIPDSTQTYPRSIIPGQITKKKYDFKSPTIDGVFVGGRGAHLTSFCNLLIEKQC